MKHQTEQLFAVSAVDGRYRSKVEELAPHVSEAGLIANRIRVEAAWLLHLNEHPELSEDIRLPGAAIEFLAALQEDVPSEWIRAVKDHEAVTNHDVKAVEYVLRDALRERSCQNQQVAFIHFACTSEDINNLAYALMLRTCRQDVILPAMDQILEQLKDQARLYAGTPMLSRTHGQTASPSTLGKELAVFAHRLSKQRRLLAELPLEGKINGAVGNFNAHVTAYPDLPWPTISRDFVEARLGLSFNPLTTQIENHDSMVLLLDHLKRFNTILIGLARDFWSYISIGYFKQQLKDGEVGSSTMPHKVNPIDFENAEGNLGLANSLCGHLSDKLLISRWQRDLSDSTVQRALGTLLGHALIAYKSLSKGLAKLSVNEDRLMEDLQQSWEVLAEPVQTVMRRYGVADAYERLKEATRGQPVDRAGIKALIENTPELPEAAKEQLLTLSPEGYTGLAEQLTHEFLDG